MIFDAELIQQSSEMQPCCMVVSGQTILGSGDRLHTAMRRWRALTIDQQDQLATGEFVTNDGDALVIVRDKATAAAREEGYEPLKFILESGGSA